MSMLRYMRDSADWKPSLLIYSNRMEKDIAFREELHEMEREPCSGLHVVHVLSKPTDEWNGEHGRIDRALLLRHSKGRSASTGYYVCGPPQMAESIGELLRDLSVPPERIHMEMFSL